MGYPNLPDTLAMAEMPRYSVLMATLGLENGPVWNLTQEQLAQLRISVSAEALRAIEEFFTWASGFKSLTEYSAALARLSDAKKVQGRKAWTKLWTVLAKRVNFNKIVEEVMVANKADPISIASMQNIRQPPRDPLKWTSIQRPALTNALLGQEAYLYDGMVFEPKANELLTVLIYQCWTRMSQRMRRVAKTYEDNLAKVDKIWNGEFIPSI